MFLSSNSLINLIIFSLTLEIRINYLTDKRDLETLIDGVEILRDVFSQKVFDKYRGEELSPGKTNRNRSSISNWVRRTASTVHHLTGLTIHIFSTHLPGA